MSVPADLGTAIAGWANALASDSANPQPTYSIDGKMVDRNAWRKYIMDNILQANKTINQYAPYIIRTRSVL